MERILFRSTNGGKPPIDFKEAVLAGQAPDYGLYMPVSLPLISPAKIESFREMEYHQIALEVMKPFIAGIMEEEYLEHLVREAYDFKIPLEKVKANFYIMWLTGGPTASFKDFAARFMSGIIGYFAEKDGKNLTILAATSGDTGGAVASAFCGLKNVRVVVLFPEAGVTAMQRKQMTTLGRNVSAFSVRGEFDDCQALVKRAFNDRRLRFLNMTSANSINFGRLLPQSVYYFYGYSRAASRRVSFSVPSGNFGNLMGGVFARMMGLPVEKFIVGVNENDEFPAFMDTGKYNPVVPSRQCSSNAMNVGHPSNLARLVDVYRGWLCDERDGEGNVIKKGVLKVKPDMDMMRDDFVSFSITGKDVDDTMVRYWNMHRVLLEPHGAVAVCAADKHNSASAVISLETADPAKFPVKIRQLLAMEPELPVSLRGMDGKKEEYFSIGSGYEEFRENIIKQLS